MVDGKIIFGCFFFYAGYLIIKVLIGGEFAMMKQTNLPFLSIVMLSMQVLFAQGMTVSGTVTDAQTGEALVGTQVFVKGTFVSATGVILFGILASFFENAIKPAFIAKRTNVHSAVILLGMFGGLFFLGILGVIIGPLILAYLLIILEIYRDKKGPGLFVQASK